MSRLERTEMLIGKTGVDKLVAAKVLIFGVGGVGGFVCEALARAGVGEMDIVDNDVISESNINRQYHRYIQNHWSKQGTGNERTNTFN